MPDGCLDPMPGGPVKPVSEGSVMVGPDGSVPAVPEASLAAKVVSCLRERGLTLAVAESLTGGCLTAALTAPAGASQAILGGAVVYATELKHQLVGVDAELLRREGPVHPEVAAQLASGVRRALAVAGRAASIGVGVTGVAGPTTQSGRPVGTVFVGLAVAEGVGLEQPILSREFVARNESTSFAEPGEHVRVLALQLNGDRASIREQTVTEVLTALCEMFD